MIKIIKQIPAGNNTLLILDSAVPNILFDSILIEGKEYDPVIAFDMDEAIGVSCKGEFEGKFIEFIKK